VGTEYIAKIKENWMDFDVLIARQTRWDS